MTTGLTTFFCPLIPVFLGLGAILSFAAAGLGLVALAADAAFLAEGVALDLVLRAAALAEPALTDGADFFSADLAAGAEAALAAAGLAAGADFGAAALGAGAGVLAEAGLAAAAAAAGADAALGAAAGVLAVAGFLSAGLDPEDPKIY